MCGQNIGIFSVVGALFHQFTLFSLFAFSNLCPLLYDEKKLPNSEESAVKFFLSPLQSIYMCIFCFFGGAVDRKLGTHFTVILGCLSICIADFLLMTSKNFALDFFFIIFYGIGFGISMTSAVGNACRYFPKNRGLINAICIGTGGKLGAGLCNFMIQRYKNNYRQYLVFHIIYMIVGTILAVGFITTFKESIMDRPLTNESDSKTERLTNSLEVEETNNDNNDIPITTQIDNIGEQQAELKVILKHWRIYYISLIFFCTFFVQDFINTVGFVLGINIVKAESSKISIIFTIMNVICCITAPIWGFLYDKFEFQKTLMLVNCLSMLNSFLIKFTSHTIITYAFSIIFNGSLNIGSFIMIYPHVSKVFGFKYAGEMYGIVVLSTGISSLIASLLLHSFGIRYNYNSCYKVFFIGSVLNLIGILLAFFETDEKFLSL
jgi:MFS family permease